MKALRLLSFSVLLLGIISLFSACGKDEKTLYYLNFKPEVAQVYTEIATKYKEETGVTLKVVTAAANSYETTLKSELAKSDAPVLFHVNGPIGYAAWADWCDDWSDTKIYSHLLDKSSAISTESGVYGIPFVTEGYGIIYNNAILQKYFALPDKAVSITSADEINTFAKLYAVVDDMERHKEELGIDGVFASTSMQSGEEWRWQTHLFNVPLYYEMVSKGSEPLSPDFHDFTFTYSDQYRQIWDLYLDHSVTPRKLIGSKSVSDSMAEFATGKCAMVQNGNWAWSQISGISGNVVKKADIKMMPIYIGNEGEENQGLCIGTENYLAINKNASAEQKAMADDFLIWLFTSETGKDFVTNKLNFIVPFDSFEKSEIPDDPLASEIYTWMNRENVKTIPWSFTIIPSQEFKNELASELLGYAQGSKTWDEVVSHTVSSWKSEQK